MSKQVKKELIGAVSWIQTGFFRDYPFAATFSTNKLKGKFIGMTTIEGN